MKEILQSCHGRRLARSWAPMTATQVGSRVHQKHRQSFQYVARATRTRERQTMQLANVATRVVIPTTDGSGQLLR